MVHERGARVARRPRPDADRRRRRRRDAARAQGRRVREGRQGARRSTPDKDPEEWGVILELHPQRARSRRTRAAGRGSPTAHPRRQRGDDDRRAPPLPDDGSRHAALPGHQRQRLGHQEQVRQHLRLPALAARRPRARHRRHARRQGRGRLRLRRSRQGLRAGAARPGLPRHRHRDRSDLRAAGGDGRLRGRRRSTTWSTTRRHLHHRDRQPQHHHRRAHGADEGQGDRRQHRPLRQRDRHGRPEEGPGHRADQHQAAVRRVALPRRPQRADPRRRPPAEPRLRDRPPELRDVGVVHQPGDRAARAAREHRASTRRRSTCCRSTSTRRWRGCTSTSSA